MSFVKPLTAIVLSFFMANMAAASVINSADVNGLKTFKDTNTGRIWLDMDNFFDAKASTGTTGVQMIATAQAAGFTFANRSDVTELLSTLPLGSAHWSTYISVMGHGSGRSMIWGMYDEGSNPYGWAYATSGLSAWGYADNMTDALTVQNSSDVGYIDLGLFAYRAGSVDIPEPGSIALVGLGIAGLLAARRRKPLA